MEKVNQHAANSDRSTTLMLMVSLYSDCSGQLQTCSDVLWKFALCRKYKKSECRSTTGQLLRSTLKLFCFPVEISAISKVQIGVNPVEHYSTYQSADLFHTIRDFTFVRALALL
jgi:hypothetical protein